MTDQVVATRLLKYMWTGSAWFCSSAPAIGDIITQYPDTDTPAHIYGGQWTVQTQYAGMFFRPEGGVAHTFIEKITGNFTSATTFVADNAFSNVAVGDLALIPTAGWTTIDAVSGTTITTHSGMPDWATLTEMFIGQPQSLPNITGDFSLGANGVNSGVVGGCGGSGAFSNKDVTSGSTVQGKATPATNYRSWDFDASRSDATYGRTAYVYPNNITVRLWKRTA